MLCKMFLAAAVASALALPAQAQETGLTYAARVSYADLDLSSQAGAEAMLTRIHETVRDLCGDRLGVRRLAELRATNTCVSDALDHAVANLHQPLVTALYEQRTDHHHNAALASAAR